MNIRGAQPEIFGSKLIKIFMIEINVYKVLLY